MTLLACARGKVLWLGSQLFIALILLNKLSSAGDRQFQGKWAPHLNSSASEIQEDGGKTFSHIYHNKVFRYPQRIELPTVPLSRHPRSTSAEVDNCEVSMEFIGQLIRTLQDLRRQFDKRSTASQVSQNTCESSFLRAQNLVTELDAWMPPYLQNSTIDSSHPEVVRIKALYAPRIEALKTQLTRVEAELERHYGPGIAQLQKTLDGLKSQLATAKVEKGRLEVENESKAKLWRTHKCWRELPNNSVTFYSHGIGSLTPDGKNPTTNTETDDDNPFGLAETCNVPLFNLSLFVKDLRSNLDLVHRTILARPSTPLDSKEEKENISIECSRAPSTIIQILRSLQAAVSDWLVHQEVMIAGVNRTFESEISRKTIELEDRQKGLRQDRELKRANLTLDIQQCRRHLTVVEGSIKQLKADRKKDASKFIVHLIQCEELVAARQEFLNNLEVKDLPDIVRTTCSNPPSHTLTTLQFIKGLPFYNYDSLGLPVLFEEMKKHENKLLGEMGLQILEMEHYVNSSLSSPRSASVQASFTKLASNLTPYVERILSKWVGQIRAGSHKEILTFAKRKFPLLKRHLGELLRAAYAGRLENVAGILSFIRELPYIEYDAIAYPAMYAEMEIQGHLDSYELVILAYRLYEVQGFTNFGKIGAENQNRLMEAYRKLPRGLRAIMGHTYVVIESTRYQHEYTLYASSAGNIYTYPHNNYEGWNNQKWVVTTLNGQYFRFKNMQNGNVLYSDEKGRALGGEDDYKNHRQQWGVVPRNKGSYFLLKNRHDGRLLDVNNLESCSSSRRCCCSTVYTSTSYPSDFQQWYIK